MASLMKVTLCLIAAITTATFGGALWAVLVLLIIACLCAIDEW